jgi:hypothetical protein
MRQFKPGQLQTGSIYNISSSYALTASYALNGGTGVGGGNYIATGSVTASVSLGNGSFTITSGSSTFMFVSSSGNVGFGTTTPIYNLHNTGTTGLSQVFGLSPSLYVYNGRTAHDSTVRFENQSGDQLYFGGNGLFVTGNTTIGNGSTSLSARLGVKGSGTTSATTALLVQNSNSETTIIAKNDRTIGLGRSAFTGEGYGGIAIGHPDAGNLQYSSYDAHTFNVFNGASYETALLIKGNGASSRVLIGPSSNTTYKFQVSGSNSSGSVNLDNTLYVSGSRVGIGTSSPAFKLEVVSGDTRFSNGVTIGTAGASGWQFSSNTVTLIQNGFIGVDVAGGRHFNITDTAFSTYYFRVAPTTGNILIGTSTDAGYKLDVNGTARFTGNIDLTTNYQIIGKGVNDAIRFATGEVRVAVSTNTGFFSIYTPSTDTTLLRVMTNGNTMIGTTTETGHKLLVSGSGASGSVNLDNTLYVSGSNVGIGTSSPSTRLHVIGSEYTFAATSGGINFYNTPGVNSHFNFTNLRQDSDYIFRQNRNGVVNTTSLILKGNTGNVLINTTTDAGFRLDVNGTARFTGTVTTPAAVFSDSSGTSRITLVGAGGGLIGTNCYLGTNAILGYNLTSGAVGNVAIGGNFNAVASAILEIRSTTKGFLPPRMTTTERNAIASPAAGLIVYETGSAATEGLWLNETTGWQQLLTNSGSQSISGSLNVTSITTSDATISGNVTVSGTASINTLIVNQIGYSSGSNQLGDAVDDTQTLYGTVRIPTGSLTVTGSITQNESTASFGGLVGIGTTTPAAKLDISGSARMQESILIGSSSISTNTTAFPLQVNFTNAASNVGAIWRNASSTGYASFRFYNDQNSGVRALEMGYAGSSYASAILSGGITGESGYLTTTGAYPLQLGSSNSARLAIFSTGNVGINQFTDAGYKLDVNGTAIIRGDFNVGGSTQSGFQFRLTNSAYFGGNLRVDGTIITNSGLTVVGPTILTGGRTVVRDGNSLLVGGSSGADTPDASALTEIRTTTKGFLPPRTNLTSNISTPAQGLMTYLTGSTNEGLYYYNSGSTPGWRQVADTTFVSASLSGSAGYLPVFTGANSVSSSIVFQSGSNVGIGTSTPTKRLEIFDSAAGDGVSIIRSGVSTQRIELIPNDATFSALIKGGGNDKPFYITSWANTGTAQPLYFGTNYSSGFNEVRMGISAAGRLGLGLGTSSVSSKFQVRGEGATSSTTALRVENSNASASLTVLDNGYVGIGKNTPISTLHLGNDTSGFLGDFTTPAITFNTLNNGIYLDTNRISFKAGGSFSFGADSNGPVGNGFRINAADYDNLTTPIFVATRLSLGINSGYGGNKAGHLSLITNNTPRLYVDFSGSVGIGTTTPSASLHISGASSATLLKIDSPALNNILFVTGSGIVSIGMSGSAYGSTGISNGKLTINNTSGNNGLAIRNGETGYQLGIRTTINDNIGTEFVWYDGSTTTFLQYGGSIGTRLGNSIIAQFRSNNDSSATIHTGGSTTERMRITSTGNVGIGRTPTSSLDVAGTTRISGSFNTATSGSILTVQGSGSAQPIFTVQGSQGELFSITDSLSGSLFSVNDISGLPILEVFSDNTTLIGNYQDPMLITTTKIVQTNSGSFTVYSLPTASYDTAFFEYSIKSGSNARAGTIMAIQLGSTVNFTETTTTDFGDTTPVSFTVIVTGSNMALTGSSTSGAWTIKTIVRGL